MTKYKSIKVTPLIPRNEYEFVMRGVFLKLADGASTSGLLGYDGTIRNLRKAWEELEKVRLGEPR